MHYSNIFLRFMRKNITGTLAVMFFAVVSTAHAQVQDVVNDGVPDGGIQISPIRFETELRPGDTWNGTLNLKNFSDEEKTVTVSSENFIVTDDTENINFYPSERSRQYQAPDIVDWIHVPQEAITIAGGGTQSIKFSVNVPKDAPTGGYYGALFVTLASAGKTSEELGRSQIGINSRMGALLIFSVKGSEPVHISGQLDAFGPTKKIFFVSPARFKTVITNSGNLHFRGGGLITISRAGRTVSTLPLHSQVSYPHKVRTYDQQWHFGLLNIGPYTATVKYESLSGLVHLEATDTFWVIPWSIILIILGVILCVIGLRHYIAAKYTIVRK